MTTSAEVLAGIERGQQILAYWEAQAEIAKAQEEANQLAENAKAWQPILATIRQATPDWLHSYITPNPAPPTFTDTYMETSYRPATIDLSSLIDGIPTIRVWAKPHNQNPSIQFEAGCHSVIHDEYSGTWRMTIEFDRYKATANDLAYFLPGNENATDRFHVALAQAVAARANLAELQAEADRRNAATDVPPAGPKKTNVSPAPVDPLERIANALEAIAATLGWQQDQQIEQLKIQAGYYDIDENNPEMQS